MLVFDTMSRASKHEMLMKITMSGLVWTLQACDTASSPSDATSPDGSVFDTRPVDLRVTDLLMVDAAPPDTSTGAVSVGSACTAESTCPTGGSGAPRCRTDWPGGYCVIEACSDHGHDCPNDGLPGGAKCVLDPAAICLALCVTESDCRDGYVCGTRDDTAGHTPTLVCVPR